MKRSLARPGVALLLAVAGCQTEPAPAPAPEATTVRVIQLKSTVADEIVPLVRARVDNVRVVPHAALNAVLVSGQPAEVARAVALIDSLDTASDR